MKSDIARLDPLIIFPAAFRFKVNNRDSLGSSCRGNT